MTIVNDPQRMSQVIADGMHLDHHHYEKMARAVSGPLASISGWAGERLDDEFGEELSISVYRPQGNRPPVVSFGNTRINFAHFFDISSDSFVQRLAEIRSDLHADAFPTGIGFYRYSYNEARIKHLLEQLVFEFRDRVVLTGHSLGGVLAQLTALRIPEFVECVVTFQSPKTIRGLVRHFYDRQTSSVIETMASQSYHYKVVGDSLIQQAGELDCPGTVVKLEYVDDWRMQAAALIGGGLATTYIAHVRKIFEPFEGSRGVPASIRPYVDMDLEQLELETIGNPSGEVQSAMSAGIEWARANGLMGLIGAATLVTESTVPIRELAIPLLKKVIYCVLWEWNVMDFRDDPQQHFQFDFDIELEPLSVDGSILFDHDEKAYLRAEFATYIRHSRVRS